LWINGGIGIVFATLVDNRATSTATEGACSMSDADRVTIKAFDTTDEAKDAERLLLEHGLSKDVVSRKGKKLRVAAEHEDQARALLAGSGESIVSSAQTSLHTVADGVQTVAGRMSDGAQSAASTLSDTAQGVTNTVSDTMHAVASTVADQVGGAVGVASERVADLAMTVREYGTDASGVQRQVARTTAGALDRTAYYLREGDINVVVDDLRDAIRRNPGRSLLLGLGLGYLARSALGDTATSGASPGASHASSDA
jgi:hypothetical protein